MNNKALILDIKFKCTVEFNSLISKVILFGSRANKSAGKYSDYDILIVITDQIDWKKKDSILDIVSDIALENDIVVDAHIISEPELKTIKGKQPYILRALESKMVA
jgi:predicted nucleotidyltransferase